MLKYSRKLTFNRLEPELDDISKNLQVTPLPNGFREFVLYSISELFANVKEHSKAKKILVKININHKNCSIEIADDGIGFRKSFLSKNIYPKDDFVAIEFALSGLSTKDPKERGFGLYSIRKLIESLQGQITIESGLAKVLIKKDGLDFKQILEKRKGVSINFISKIKKLDFYKIIK